MLYIWAQGNLLHL